MVAENPGGSTLADVLDDTVGEYRDHARKTRLRALEELSRQLRLSGWQAVPTTPAHSCDPPWMRVYRLDETCGIRRGHIEVRRDLGAVDWYCWRDGEPIAPADSPETAAELIEAAL